MISIRRFDFYFYKLNTYHKLMLEKTIQRNEDSVNRFVIQIINNIIFIR